VTLAVLRRRNRLRIVATLMIATVLYWLAVMLAAVVVGVVVFVRIFAEGGEVPTDRDGLVAVGLILLGVIVLSAVIGTVISLVRLPLLRSRLEQRVLAETGAHVDTGDEHLRIRNILEALAIAADIPPPRFAVVDDDAPNSFAVGTRPSRAIVAVTRGAIEKLSRDELEAILAYEVSRIDSSDVALSSWTVAITGAAIAAMDDGVTQFVGWIPYKGSIWLQNWATRDTARERDRAAVRFTRNPASLVDALEVLDRDQTEIRAVTRATAPLWIEVPRRVYGGGEAPRLSERVAALREIAGLEPESSQEQPQ
jgi:Zn-dependent protease with chaperone function